MFNTKNMQGLYYGYLKIDIFVLMKFQMFAFKFPYMQNNKPHVQYNEYARSILWIPENGHICVNEIPNVCLQIPLAHVVEPEDRELRTLNNFILLKEWHIARYLDIGMNFLAIKATYKFIFYLKDFPCKITLRLFLHHFGLL